MPEMTGSPSSTSLPDTDVARTGDLHPKQPKRKCPNPKNAESSNSGERKKPRYKGVTCRRDCSNVRFEAHLWDNSWWNETRTKRGRQVYLGAYKTEEEAARAFDRAALKYKGAGAALNFPVETYAKEIEEMENVPKEEYVMSLRRGSHSFSRGKCEYRGVTRHREGKWMARNRIGKIMGQKCLYLGLFESPEEAAQAYDKAVITYKGPGAATNFDSKIYVLDNSLAGNLLTGPGAPVPEAAGEHPLLAVDGDMHDMLLEDSLAVNQPTVPDVPVLEAAGGQQDALLTGDDGWEFDPDSLFIDGDVPDEDPVAGA